MGPEQETQEWWDAYIEGWIKRLSDELIDADADLERRDGLMKELIERAKERRADGRDEPLDLMLRSLIHGEIQAYGATSCETCLQHLEQVSDFPAIEALATAASERKTTMLDVCSSYIHAFHAGDHAT